MGIFSSKKKTYVSSVVYNLAGDEFKRPNYLKTTVVGSVINDSPSIADSIVGSYLNGPGIRFRRFYRWADYSGYNDLIGLVKGTIKTGDSLDPDALALEIDSPAGTTVRLLSSDIGDADYTFWADRYVMENFPDRLDTEYVSDMDEKYNLIQITWDDDTSDVFTPVDFVKNSQYIYARYVEEDDGDSTLSDQKLFIYKRFSGNTNLDLMFSPSESMGGFYPVIPIRLDGKFVSDSFLPMVYKEAKKGYKKATTGKLDDIVDELKDNEDIDDIDYTYIVFGTCLNVMEKASRKYIFQFFHEILNDYTIPDNEEFNDWQIEWNTAKDSWDLWYIWEAAQDDPSDPLYETTAPKRLMYPSMPIKSIKVSTGSNPTINYDMTISWNSIIESYGNGLLKPDAKRDEIWFSKGAEDDYDQEGGEISIGTVYLNWQVTATTWRRMRFVGLKHRNMIYGGKAVEISAIEALDDPEESGFIVPLHDGVYRSMGLKDGTQMSTACSYIMFNSYQIVKKKWYQRGAFKIILVVIVIVVAYYTAGQSLAKSGGLLGTNAVAGTALLGAGASAAAIAIVGAVANAIAAVLITQTITKASTEIFGDKIGAIVGAIASYIALNVGSAMMNGQSMSSAFGGMMKADNIMSLTAAAGQGYAGYVNASIAEMAAEQQNVMDNYKVESKKVSDAWEENLGHGNGLIDPMILTDVFGVTMEEMDSFLQRTLMTGSDVSDMSLDMLTNFVRMTLNTDLPS